MALSRFASNALLALMLLVPATSTFAQESSPSPDITVRQEEDRTIREYRVNGQLYAIRIEPRRGPAYFLVDDDGDGDFEVSNSERIAIPSWVLFSW